VPQVPTNQMERELRKLYLRWLVGVPSHPNTAEYLGVFEAQSRKLITKLGGQAASLGAYADFPVPKTLELSPRAGVVYDEMRQAAISASITAGLNSKDAARAMLNAGLDKGYRKLERLARTETVSAYWKNQWDSTADLPLIVMLWGSEESKRTCDYCLSRDGLVVEDGNIRDHPNGRCTLIPTLRTRVNYKGTLQPDGSVTMDPKWSDQKVKGAKAQASAGPTTAEQRDPLSGKSNPAAPSQAQSTQSVAPKPTPPVPNLPEEKFVANLQGLLDNGSITVKQLLAQAESASDLAKINVQAAVERHSAALAARKAEAAAAKATRSATVRKVTPKPEGVTEITGVNGMKRWGKTMPKPSTLLPDARKVTDTYTSNAAYSINAILRGQSKVFDKNPISGQQRTVAKNIVPKLDAMMDKSKVTEAVQVVRGVELNAFGGEEALLKLVGKTYRDRGYLSTSLNNKLDTSVYDVAASGVPVEMKITVPQGTRALYLGEESDTLGERELLLDRGTKMALQTATYNPRRKLWEVTATVLPGKRP
jgi:hypothetical protein